MRWGKLKNQHTGLIEGLGQKWSLNSYRKIYTDQFGFEIYYGNAQAKYQLRMKGVFILEFNSLQAAKVVSTIILNDKILNGKVIKS
jgi:hypothetical protein